MNKITIVFPAADSDSLSNALRMLTEAIATNCPDLVGHGIFGGEFGYGADYENDIFMMHAYCWCEQGGCQWCSRSEPNFWHKSSGLKVWWYKYIGRSQHVENMDGIDLAVIFNECIESL